MPLPPYSRATTKLRTSASFGEYISSTTQPMISPSASATTYEGIKLCSSLNVLRKIFFSATKGSMHLAIASRSLSLAGRIITSVEICLLTLCLLLCGLRLQNLAHFDKRYQIVITTLYALLGCYDLILRSFRQTALVF